MSQLVIGIFVVGIVMLACVAIPVFFVLRHFAKDDQAEANQATAVTPPLSVNEEVDEEVDELDEIDEEGEKAIQKIAIAENLMEAGEKGQQAAEKLKKSAEKLIEAEEALMTAEMHRDIRIEEQNKNLEKEVAAKKAEIEAKANLAREEILSNEKIDREMKQRAFDHISCQKEAGLRMLYEKADFERRRIDEQSKLDQKEARRKKAEQDAELALAREREEAESKARINRSIEESIREINREKLRLAKKSRKSLSAELFPVASFVLIIGAIIIILEKLF